MLKRRIRAFLNDYISIMQNDAIVKAIQESRIPYSLLSNYGEFLCAPMMFTDKGTVAPSFPDHQLIEDVSKELASFYFADLDIIINAAAGLHSSTALAWTWIKEKGDTADLPVSINLDSFSSLYSKITYLFDSIINYGMLDANTSNSMFDAFLLALWSCAISNVKYSDSRLAQVISETIQDIKAVSIANYQFISQNTLTLWEMQKMISDNDMVELLYSLNDYEESSIIYHLANRIYLREKNILWMDAYTDAYGIVRDAIDKIQKREYIANLLNGKSSPRITIQDVDKMDPAMFERMIASLFNKMGYEAYPTQKSRDQGVDVIACKRDRKIAIQAKCYRHTVGNSAVQEVVAGKNYYQADDAFVITNSTFTRAAIQLAFANNVKLWDRKCLAENLNRYNFCDCDLYAV